MPSNTPSLAELKRSPHWLALKPIVYEGGRAAEQNKWANPHPKDTLRYHAYEVGFDLWESLESDINQP